jgi:hypothetical protein
MPVYSDICHYISIYCNVSFADGEESDPDGGQTTAAEVTLMLLDWMCTHKVADSAARDVWSLVRSAVPAHIGANTPTFWKVKRILSKVQTQYVQRIDVCPNDCVAFWDSTHLTTPYRHAHRLKCPTCGASRFVNDPSDGAQRAAKMFFFFPLAPYVRSLYARPDLVPYLYADRYDPAEPVGSIRRSRGWKQKMHDNPHMARDHRNLGFVETTDGVPFFKDQRRGGWPYIIRYYIGI